MVSIKKNFVFNIIRSIAPMVFSVISFAYASRVLGVNGIGRVQYCTSVISYFALFAALGTSLYATREGSKIRNDRAALSKLFKEMLTINLITTVLVYVAIFLSLTTKAFAGYQWLMLICSLSILFTTLSVEWIYQIVEDFQFISLCSIGIQLISFLLLLLFVKDAGDLKMYAFTTVFSLSGSFLFNIIYARKYVDFKSKAKLNLRKHIKPILIIFGIGVASSIYLNLDTIMIRWIKSEHAVGLYAVAVKVNTLVKTLIASISMVVLPRLSVYLTQGKKKEYESLLEKGVHLNLALSIPCSVGIFLLSEQIIALYSGVDYLGGTMTSKILAINIAFSAIDGLLYYQVLIPYGKEKMACIGTAVGAVSNLILNALLIPVWSIEGAAVATLLSEMCVFIMFCIFLHKDVPLLNMFRELYKYLIGSAAIVLVVWICGKLMSNIILYTLASVVFAAAAYFVVLFFLKESIIREFFKDIKKRLPFVK